MGREANISSEQVHSAADAIRLEGGNPTLRSIRERLGTGSMGTINKHLQQWRGAQEQRVASDLALPPALQRALLDFMASELSAARAPFEAELVEQRLNSADLASENERQASTIDALNAAIDSLTAERSAVEGRAGQLALDLDAAKDEAARERAAAEMARTELAKSLLRLEAMPRLESDLEALQLQLDQERVRRIDAEQQSAVLTAQKTDLDARYSDLRDSLASSTSSLSLARDRAEQLASQLSDARVLAQGFQARIDESAASALSSKAEARALGDKLAVLVSQRDELTARLSALKPSPRKRPAKK